MNCFRSDAIKSIKSIKEIISILAMLSAYKETGDKKLF